MRKKLEDQTNWNTLFLNPNSILESIASKFSMKKVKNKKLLIFLKLITNLLLLNYNYINYL